MSRTSKVLEHALEIDELYMQLADIDTADLECEVHELSDYHIVMEALYKISCYQEGGHILNEHLAGEDGKEAMLEARKNLKQLKTFVKKYPLLKQNRKGLSAYTGAIPSYISKLLT